MIAGHFATALVAKQQEPRGALWFYLGISQLPDWLWHAFHFGGIEPTMPDNPMLASLDTMAVEMTYSHDLVPAFGWVGLAVLLGRGVTGSWRPGWVAGALVLAHLLCDAISGHTHYVFGPESPAIGLGLYGTHPYLALGIEAIFTAAMVGWVVVADRRQGVRRSRAALAVWGLILFGGIASMVPTADLSLVELTGWEPVAALSGTFVPGVVAMYVAMVGALLWADAQPTERVDA